MTLIPFLCTLFGAGLTLAVNVAGATCERAVALSRDARYVEFEIPTLRVLDVGNLWWLGVYQTEGAIEGSTVETGAIWVERHSIGSPDREMGPALAALPDLGRPRGFGKRLNFMRSNPVAANEARFIDTDTILVRKFINGEASVSLFDTSLQKLTEVDSDIRGLGAFSVCELSDETYALSGLKIVAKISNSGDVSAPIPVGDDMFRFADVSNGCVALMLAQPPGLKSMRNRYRVVDLETGTTLNEFDAERYATNILISEGRQLFQQLRDATVVAEGTGVRVQPTKQVRIVDTSNSSILMEATLPEVGTVSRLACGTDYLIVEREFSIDLLDTESLKVVSTLQLPFDRFDVF